MLNTGYSISARGLGVHVFNLVSAIVPVKTKLFNEQHEIAHLKTSKT